MKKISLQKWFNRNTRKPLIIIATSALFLMLTSITFWSFYSKSNQAQHIDQLVRIASHGLKYNNRPLLESIIDMGFNELSANSIIICRKEEVLLAYPTKNGSCTNIQSSLLHSLIVRQAKGNQDYTFYFMIPTLPSFRIWLLLVLMTIIILLSGWYLIWRVQKSLMKDIFNPLQTILNQQQPLTIIELEDIRKNHIRYTMLKEKNAATEAIASLTQHLAHDIRKPLSQVRVVLDAFDMFKSNPSRLEVAKKDIKKAISNVEGMLADVMNFSRDVKLDTSAKSLYRVLNLTIRQVVQETATFNISFVYNFQTRKKLLIDEERFSRVLSNIIGNGIEAITVIGKKNNGTIKIETDEYNKNGKKFVEIIISNDGPHFPEGSEDKLFESFFTNGKSKGTGLGLASAKKIVTLHEGEVFARNQQDKEGVEFIIRIPASNEIDETSQGKLPQSNHDALQSKEELIGIDALIQKMDGKVYKTILLEDEALYRAWIKNLIQGNDVLQKSIVLYDATTVEEALALVEKEDASHAIVDIDLESSQDGFDFLKAVKDKKSLKTIVHSNRTLDEFKKKALDLGASGFVPKPLPLSSLVEFITETISTELPTINKSLGKLVYCCDDSQLIRDHLEFLFTAYLSEHINAFKFVIFKTGEELISSSQDIKPDLIFTDLNMEEAGGKLNGYQVIKEIKMISQTINAYLVSNEPLSLSEEPTHEAGGDGPLEQPLSKEVIYPLLDMLAT